jgi:DNA-binding CsgD family transcriptional regulator
VTTNVLLPFLPKLARCQKASDVNGIMMDVIKGTFGCHFGAALFHNESRVVTDRVFFGIRHSDIQDYVDYWRPQGKLFQAVLARAVPVHNWQVYGEDHWQRHPIWTKYLKHLQIYQAMVAPLFGPQGHLIGTLHLARRAHEPRFGTPELELASALTGFSSTTLSRVATTGLVQDHAPGRLARRELQVARLAASGRNNAEIAKELGIARETVKQALGRVYSKLDVSGRAQMAATLAARGFLGQLPLPREARGEHLRPSSRLAT